MPAWRGDVDGNNTTYEVFALRGGSGSSNPIDLILEADAKGTAMSPLVALLGVLAVIALLMRCVFRTGLVRLGRRAKSID